MTFEVYKPRREKQEKTALVSLSKTSVVLNNVARAKLQAKRIELAYDKDSKTIRIKAMEEGGMEIRKTKVFGKGFFNQFEITQKGKFEATYDPDENALFVTLP